MKKFLYLIACAVMGLSLMGCSSTSKDQAYPTQTIYFANNSAVISQADQTKINDFVTYHRKKCNGCDYLAQVDGYTNTIGTESYNLKLSERRALAVRKALIKAGIAPCVVLAKGYGESNPIADNKTLEGLKLNRRATISLTDHSDVIICKYKNTNCQCGDACTCITVCKGGTMPCTKECKCAK